MKKVPGRRKQKIEPGTSSECCFRNTRFPHAIYFTLKNSFERCCCNSLQKTKHRLLEVKYTFSTDLLTWLLHSTNRVYFLKLPGQALYFLIKNFSVQCLEMSNPLNCSECTFTAEITSRTFIFCKTPRKLFI